MYPGITISDIARHEDQEVTLAGWLYNMRSSKTLHFLQLRDGSGIIQCVVYKPEAAEEVWNLCSGLTQESAIRVTGKVRKEPRSSIGYEIAVSKVELVHQAVDYPITPKEHGVAFLMENRHLWLRSRRQHIILRVRAAIIKAIRDYFDNNGFTLVDCPILTPNACEGTTTLFETDYFGEPAYLSQSGQLYNEATAMAFGKTYCFGPTFRAEKSKTRRHLMEFWMVEPEVAWMDLDGDMDLAEDFLVYVVGRVLEKHEKELAELERDVSFLKNVKKPFPRISYTDAVKQLQSLGSDIQWGSDFGGDDETILTRQYDRPIMVHRYPAAVKAFYMKKDPSNPDLALCVDVLAPEGYGEIVGGGQREDNYGVLEASIQHHGLPLEAFKWFLDLRRYGSVPHAGFGLGVERTVAWICGLQHVRETIPFPRMLEKIWP
ncbi:MAG: Asparagine--tRNA ligase [Myxococcota bacterium]|nr:Asparagine--tRNA ligase [Myxococcota bacterium]